MAFFDRRKKKKSIRRPELDVPVDLPENLADSEEGLGQEEALDQEEARDLKEARDLEEPADRADVPTDSDDGSPVDDATNSADSKDLADSENAAEGVQSDEPQLRKPEALDKAQRNEKLRETLMQAAYPEDKDAEELDDESLNHVDDQVETKEGQEQTTQPVRVVAETIVPVMDVEELPPEERFMTSKIPLTRRERQTMVNPDFADARAKTRRRFDSDMLELPEAPVYKIPEEERDALHTMNDVPSRIDVRDDEEQGSSGVTEILEFLKLVIIALIIGILLTQFVIQRSVVDGSSMHPTLVHKDQLIVEKVSRYFGPPKRGRILTLHHPNNRDKRNEKKEDLVKRVVGLPGETVEIKNGGVYINGELLEEDYIAPNIDTRPGNRGFDKVTLADNEIYVLGDNRPHSSDSRAFGPIYLDEISGAVGIRIWPLDRFGIPR